MEKNELRLIKMIDINFAKALIDQANNMLIKGRQIHFRFDRSALVSHPSKPRNCTIVVGNLAWNINHEQLKDLCKDYNPLIIQIMTNMRGRSRGFALVWFADEMNAAACLNEINGKEVMGRVIDCHMDQHTSQKH
jgi:RNA recognition motif-containing protein